MGVREKTEFSLQTACLVSAVAALLFFWAARNYSTDWRERRLFRRRLAATHRRLTAPATKESEGKGESESIGRVPWKRFVAAVPLVPLATAYVAVRLGWDVFEVLAFCAIDAARHAAARALRLLPACLDAAAAPSIAAVECAADWLLHAALPAIAGALSRAASGAEAAARWWERVDGAARLRDAVEAAVLGGLVPGVAAAQRAAAAAGRRLAWLAGRAAEAAVILGADLIRDMRVLAAWAVAAAAWLRCDRRWWRDPALRLAAARAACACAAWLRQMRRLAATRVAPLVGRALRLGWALGARAARASWQMADALLLQRVLGAAVRACGHMAPLARRAARLWMRRADLLLRLLMRSADLIMRRADLLAPLLARGLRTAGRHMRVLARASVRALAQAAALGAELHAWAAARLLLLLPAARLAAAAAARVGGAAQAGAAWAAWAVGGLLASAAVRDAARYAEAACGAAAAWVAASIVDDVRPLLRVGVDFWWWAVQMVSSAGDALWPMLVCGWRDAARAMADVYAQLVALVDSAVALVGDHIVDYARQSTVHSAGSSSSSSSSKVQ
ncbi:hypothetical protein GGF42_005561 [Coemansia sp. RSA 2424]|nr:hypothetical protein GGF42_005561 [Coemansia sp. RSA 2424]